MSKWKSILVIYDVEDNKSRNKVVKELESYGKRVQKSAFECYVDEARQKRLVSKLTGIAGENDSIRIYYPQDDVYDIRKGDIDIYSQGNVFV